ncbi:phage holin family protein [uncultured Winogradskyella sp.]|uniref:phage holin family protein n=1 Tax=uncultured Winogradskyella sp. TaxID=395353 RepID=UPI00262706B7|nr:phage holin family protein [uncultured Winogradskyella sp.]
MGATKNIGALSAESFDNSQEYVKHSWEYYKLKLFMHSAELTTNIVKLSLYGFFALMGFLLLSLALAIFLGEVLNNSALGYICVGVSYFILIAILYFLRKKIEKFVILKLSKSVFNDE